MGFLPGAQGCGALWHRDRCRRRNARRRRIADAAREWAVAHLAADRRRGAGGGDELRREALDLERAREGGGRRQGLDLERRLRQCAGTEREKKEKRESSHGLPREDAGKLVDAVDGGDRAADERGADLVFRRIDDAERSELSDRLLARR